MRPLAICFLILFASLVGASGCAPEPRNVSCTNDAMCEKLGEGFHYCLESRCVECVGSASCGEGQACLDGACVCNSDRGCKQGEKCVDGECKVGG